VTTEKTFYETIKFGPVFNIELIFKGMFSRHGAKQPKDTLAKISQKTIMPDDQIEFFRTILSRYLGDLCALA
jgi:hypothetical protein